MASAAASVLCDLVWADPVSNNHTILGIFTQIRASKFPTPLREISAYALLVGDPGEFGDLGLICFMADHNEDNAIYDTRTGVLFGPEGKVQIHIRLGKLSFPTPGNYVFVLTFHSKMIAEFTIPVLTKGQAP